MNVVFLDIDGVVQPHNSFTRFDYMNYDTIKYLSDKYHTDWEFSAVERLKYILDSTNSRIIISSNWREPNNSYKMYDLLKIQGLDKYYYADNPYIIEDSSYYKIRTKEINASLNKYDIKNYVILDDMVDLIRYFPSNFVCVNNYINDKDVERAIKILKKNN